MNAIRRLLHLDWRRHVEVGVSYCLVHSGLADVDDGDQCRWAHYTHDHVSGLLFDCVLVPLSYRRRWRDVLRGDRL